MVVKEHSEVVIDEEISDEQEMPLLENASDDCVEYPIEDKALVVKQALNL